MTLPWFQRGNRRMLLDMHIADWDDKFLSKYDACKMADLYQQAALTSVMFYCQAHTGLCYWPTATGRMHAGLKGRDIVKEMLAALQARGIAACGYYSLIFNNWAFLEHPEWRQQPGQEAPSGFGAFADSRYGLVCPNNPGYVDFVMRQIEELAGGYAFDGMFYDMTFWPTVCVCPHCTERFRREAHLEIPRTVNWFDRDWCAFVAARERWLYAFGKAVTDKTRAVQPGIGVYHNCSSIAEPWTRGVGARMAEINDFMGGDFYGDALDALVVCKTMLNMTPRRPLEFMTSRCLGLGEHERTKSCEQMELAAMAAPFFSAAFLFIDAINLDGTVNPRVYRRIGKLFRETEVYEPFQGGEQVEDIGVYFSADSKMSFEENGQPMPCSLNGSDYPHYKAVRGAVRVLQQAHVPFGIVNRLQLGSLARYKVIVLPNVLRMDRQEAEAFRAYVQNGGRLYASRYTSLVETEGVRHDDFMLADIFGCHLAGDDLGAVTYLNLRDRELARLIEPQKYLSHFSPVDRSGTLRLTAETTGRVLATLTLPFAREWGDVSHQNWASIHSSPPWKHTGSPVIVLNRFGQGRVVYSAADIEAVEGETNHRLFLHLIRSLMDDAPTYTADTHPAVWMTASHQPDHNRYTLGFLNNQAQLPAIPIPKVPFTLRPPTGKSFTRLVRLPRATPVPFTTDAAGTLHARAPRLKVFEMLMAEYA